MKTLNQFIKEAEESDADEQAKLNRRGNIKFTIWEEPDKKVKWLKSNDKYQKIEYNKVYYINNSIYMKVQLILLFFFGDLFKLKE